MPLWLTLSPPVSYVSGIGEGRAVTASAAAARERLALGIDSKPLSMNLRSSV